jgi:hypothetical protein
LAQETAPNNPLEAVRAFEADNRGVGKRPVSFGVENEMRASLLIVLLQSSNANQALATCCATKPS